MVDGIGYPLYDRSGVDDDGPAPIAWSEVDVHEREIVEASAASAAEASEVESEAESEAESDEAMDVVDAADDGVVAEIHVCQAGPCRARGGEAVLAEIEELASAVGQCSVRESGCLGYCQRAPNALVRPKRGGKRGAYSVQSRLLPLEASAKVVEYATGRTPPLGDEGMNARLADLRAARSREYARTVFHWNTALRGLAEQVTRRPALRSELDQLLGACGFSLESFAGGAAAMAQAGMPQAIESYSPWTLKEVVAVSKHSAIFRYASSDLKRGTPHPRGRGRMPEPVTWHTTLLAEVGANEEGPLPWIERDYTPVSTAKEWEKGTVDLMIKIYPDGAATSWLHRAAPQRVWLSKPVKTLSVPSLVKDGDGFRPASVLLLLAGTGVVALPQILQHRDPNRQLGISTPQRDQLRVPIDLVLSCRGDDVLMLSQLAKWCTEGIFKETSGVRHCTLLLTAPNAHAPPFADATTGDAAEAEKALRGLENARVLHTRLSPQLLGESLARMPRRCRVLVSGPGEFNSAAREMLDGFGEVAEDITVLAA